MHHWPSWVILETDDAGMQQEWRIIIKFLVAEGVPSAEIHHRLAAAFKDDCLIHVYLRGILVFAMADSTWHLLLQRN